MKRRVFYAVVLVLMAVSFNSCEELNDCKDCELVKYINGVEDDRGDSIEYCGATLAAKEALGTYSLGGNITARWDCQ